MNWSNWNSSLKSMVLLFLHLLWMRKVGYMLLYNYLIDILESDSEEFDSEPYPEIPAEREVWYIYVLILLVQWWVDGSCPECEVKGCRSCRSWCILLSIIITIEICWSCWVFNWVSSKPVFQSDPDSTCWILVKGKSPQT